MSFSEIDPYACAVLAERWPGVPNLGSIVDVAAGAGYLDPGARGRVTGGDGPQRPESGAAGGRRRVEPRADGSDWHHATLWTGGFPCQDLSIAGKRRGLAGGRSGLAFAYLDLVARHLPPWVLLENVPGLLSSNRGRDLAVLLGRLAELGYGVGWRVLDARYFGVAQRRRRVFILASRDPGGRAGADRASEVLSVAASGGGHLAPGSEARTGAAGGADGRAHGPSLYNATAAFGQWEPGDEAGTLSRRDYKSSNHLLLANAVSASAGHHGHSSPRGDGSDNLVVGAADDGLASTVFAAYGTKWNGNAGAWSGGNFALAGPPDHAGGQGRRGQGSADLGQREPDPRHESDTNALRRPLGASPDADRDGATDGLAGWAHHRPVLADEGVVQSLDTKRGGPDDNEAQAGHLIPVYGKLHRASSINDHETWGPAEVSSTLNGMDGDYTTLPVGTSIGDDPLLPLGLDSHRYRCCGNGVVSNVAEAIGRALRMTLEAEEMAA